MSDNPEKPEGETSADGKPSAGGCGCLVDIAVGLPLSYWLFRTVAPPDWSFAKWLAWDFLAGLASFAAFWTLIGLAIVGMAVYQLFRRK